MNNKFGMIGLIFIGVCMVIPIHQKRTRSDQRGLLPQIVESQPHNTT
jgi:hypothetical protein